MIKRFQVNSHSEKSWTSLSSVESNSMYFVPKMHNLIAKNTKKFWILIEFRSGSSHKKVETVPSAFGFLGLRIAFGTVSASKSYFLGWIQIYVSFDSKRVFFFSHWTINFHHERALKIWYKWILLHITLNYKNKHIQINKYISNSHPTN